MTGQNRGVQQRGRLALALTLLTAATALAEKKTVLVSAGDCTDPTLITATRDLRDAAARLLGPQLVEGEVVLDIVRPRPTRSLAEIDRQLDSARTLFYGGQGDRALELVDRALEELERASPETRPWASTANALVLKALIARGAEKPKEANEAFKQIARIDPAFKLDPDAYPPSVVSAFEATKKELARARKTMVLLRAESGEATIFIDGRPMGTSPLKVELIQGSYRVALVQGSAVSFPHRLEAPRDSKVNVDLAFEGSVSAQPPLCISGNSEGSAVKLAQLVAAERVVVVRNTGRRGEPPFFSGAVFDLSTGRKEREGAVQPELLTNLATFLVTGREMTGVKKVGAPEPTKPAEVKPTETKPEDVKPGEVAKPVDTKQPEPVVLAPKSIEPSVVEPVSSGLGARVVSITLIAAGAVSFAAGIATFTSLSAERTRYLGITQMGILPSPNTSARQDALDLAAQLDGNATATWLLIGAGVGGAAAGILGLVLFPAAPVKVSASAAPGAGALFVRGSF